MTEENNIYLAAPIVGITEEMKQEIHCIEKILGKAGFNVYNPRNHGASNAWGCSLDEWCRVIFELDVAAIDRCEWLVVMDYGRQSTAGTAWECGYAFGTKKKILIIEMYEENEYSVMMRGSSANYCKLADFVTVDVATIRDKFFVQRGRINSGVTVLN